MQKPPPLSAFLHPRYWPTWTGIALLLLIAWLPFALRMRVGQLVGMLTWLLGRERRYITSINIGLCFPELTPAQQETLVKESFRENGIGLIETATAWVRKPDRFWKRTTVIGLDKLQQAQKRGRGILLIGAHYSTLDMGGNLLANFHSFAATYRPHNNPLFDAFILRGRSTNNITIFDRNDIRGAFRHLKQGKTLWYAPDQDYGPEHAVYAPFFGNNAATITAASRYAAFNNSPTFLIRHHRTSNSGHFEIEFTPFPDTFPADDDIENATLINAMIETAIRRYPAQYLWMHKRFKTQPGGKPESPYIDIGTPTHRLSEQQYRQMLEGAQELSSQENVRDYQLGNGLRLRQYPGLVGKRFYQHHPAKIFDAHAKALRMQGFPCITVDNFFRVESLQISAVTFFTAPGEPLQPPWPISLLAGFMADLHGQGFRWQQPGAGQLARKGNTLAVADPTPFSLGRRLTLADRLSALNALAANLQLDEHGTRDLFSQYTSAAGLPAGALGQA